MILERMAQRSLGLGMARRERLNGGSPSNGANAAERLLKFYIVILT
jgi:hypothetical protein